MADTTKIELGLSVTLAWLAKRSKTTTDDKILERIMTNVRELEAAGEITDEKFVKEGIVQTVDGITDLIPGEWDDTIVDNTVNMASGVLLSKLKKSKV